MSKPLEHKHKYMETEIDGRYGLVCECGKPEPENIPYEELDEAITQILAEPTTTQSKDELLTQICKIFNVFPEELEYDLPGGIGSKKANELLALISKQREQARQELASDLRGWAEQAKMSKIPLSILDHYSKRKGDK